MATGIKTTVTCPLCKKEIPGVVDTLTRTDILMGHLVKDHGSRARPNLPQEGPPVPHGWGLKWPWRK